ncbi:hypothetical protein KVK00_00285 [Helicobacter pylori]|nr:hypothetical protein KVK00_00285 [Helicobacter pylori]
MELLAFEAYGQNFQTLKSKDIAIAKPNYDRIDTQRFGSFMQNSNTVRLNLQKIASKLHPFLENLDANTIEAIEENEEFEVKGFEKEFKVKLFDRNGGEVEEDGFKVDCKELLKFLKDKIDDGVANFFAGFSKVMAENIDDECRVFHIFLGGNASCSVLVKQAFENAKEEQLKAYKQKTSKDDFTFILYEPLGTEKSDKQILELTGEDVSNTPAYLKPTCKTGVAFGLLESRPKAGGIERPSINSNPVFKYDLGIEREGKFHARISRDSLKPNEYQIFQTKEEWGGFDGLEIRYSDKPLANTNTLDIEDTQLIFIALEEHEEVDVKVCCIDSQSIKVGLFKDGQLIYESEAEKL